MIRGAWLLLLTLLASQLAHADLRAPGWFDPTWHYRVPISVPAAATVDSTLVVDADFPAYLAALGLTGTFDANSARITRADGTTLATTAQFTDEVRAGATDAVGNGQGELRFLLEDPGPVTYYVYFDVTENGAKAAWPAASAINGSFERSAGAVPTNWTVTAANANGAQNNEVHYTPPEPAIIPLPAGCSGNAVAALDNTSFAGPAWHLLGYRDNCEDGAAGNVELIQLSRAIQVPAVNPGTFDYMFQYQAYDSFTAGGTTNYDWMRLEVNGGLVNHTTLGIPNPGGILRIRNIGVGRLNGFSVVAQDAGWQPASLNLAPWAGQNIVIRFSMRSYGPDNVYRSWVKLDEVEWSRQNGTIVAAQTEAFGTNVIGPSDTAVATASVYNVYQTLAVQAVVDAAASAVTADVLDSTATAVATGVVLFDDGTHGDTVAGDNTWTNDGSDPGFPTYTFLTSDTPAVNWQVVVYAADASTSTIGGTNGLAHISGQPNLPENQANFWNIDQQLFEMANLDILMLKTVLAQSDPFNGTTNPKAIPGGVVEYTVVATNQGQSTSDANTVAIVDAIPANTELVVTDIGGAGSGPVRFTEGGNPSTLTYTFVALGNGADDVQFSNDGGATYTHSPAVGPNGTDGTVTHIRVTPQGSFAGDSGSGPRSFQIQFRVRVNY